MDQQLPIVLSGVLPSASFQDEGPSVGEHEASYAPSSNVTSNRFSHPRVQLYLQPHTGFEVATEAYHAALQSLGQSLSKEELDQIRATSSIQHLHGIAINALNVGCKGTSGRLQNFVRMLDHYSGVLDILSQSHAEYCCLVWGAMRWLLQASMNYYNLLQRLAVMLEEIGHNLPRFLLYQQILPTSRMSSIISELYATIVEFLHQTITFFRRRKIRRYFSGFWTPFELKFRDTVEKIQRLQTCVENDARATALVQQQVRNAEFARQLRELNLVTAHTLQSILEVKKQQVAILLLEIRRNILSGYEEDFAYQRDVVTFYNCSRSPEWEIWVAEEMRYVVWPHARPGLTYAQTETIQPAVSAALIARWSRDASLQPKNVFAYLFWSPRMTGISALACLIFQLLEQHSELCLFKYPPNFYAQKFLRESVSFDYLWHIFVEMISGIAGLRCLVIIPSFGLEASMFVKKAIDSHLSGTSSLLSMVIYRGTDLNLPAAVHTVELDSEYDIAPNLETCEAFSKVVLLEFCYFDTLSERMKCYIWSTLWTTLRYNLMVTTFHVVLRVINVHQGTTRGESTGLPSGGREWWSRDSLNSDHLRNGHARALKRRIINFLNCIPYEIPVAVLARLRSVVKSSTSNDIMTVPDLMKMPSEGVKVAEQRTSNQHYTGCYNSLTRDTVWTRAERILENIIIETFNAKISDRLDEIPNVNLRTSSPDWLFPNNVGILDFIGRTVFTFEKWDTQRLEIAQQSLQEGLAKAIEVGLQESRRSYILSTLPVVVETNDLDELKRVVSLDSNESLDVS